MKKLLAYAALVSMQLVSMQVIAAAPPGWMLAGSDPKNYEFGTDVAKPADGKKSAFIKAGPGAGASGFGTLMQMFPADDYRGGRWRLSARMRTQEAVKAQMWMRIDGPDNKLKAFDNMENRPVRGNTDWTRYEIVLDVPTDSVAVAFGFFLAGNGGEVWADDFKLERVPLTVPVTAAAPAPAPPRGPTNLDFEQ